MCGSRHHHHPTGRRQDLRASDAEREAVISDLRHHAGEGRLTVEELEQRIDASQAAATRRDLIALTSDLPRIRRPRDTRRELAGHLRSYLWVMALLVGIWLATGMGYFWPVWPALGWGIAIAMHAPSALRPRRIART
jgi:hypothetical protein